MAATGITATLVFSGGITFATTNIIRSLSGFREFVEILDNTVLGTTGYRASCPDDLLDIDPVEITFLADEGHPRPIPGQIGQLVITFAEGGSAAWILTGSGFFNEWTTPERTPGVRLEATAQFKFDGVTGPTWSTS